MSSFSLLTVVNIVLAIYATVLFIKLIVQFGLPNHPSKFTAYAVSFCPCAFLLMESATALNFIGPMDWIRWRPLPIVCGSLGLLFQAITTSGQFGLVQQKIFSRLPLIAGLVCFAFFPSKADVIFVISIGAGVLFLGFSMGKARYQKRAFLKMSLFLGLLGLCRLFDHYWVYNLGQIFLFFSLFYFYLFEHTFGISAVIDHLADAE